MRLTDLCSIRLHGGYLEPRTRRCHLGHVGGESGSNDPVRPNLYVETARMLVEPDPFLAARGSTAGLTVEHKGRTYNVTSILPRYRQGGRLHHISLDLQAVSG